MENKDKIHYELPTILPHGWMKGVAIALGIHRNSVYNAIHRGEDDPLYKKVMHTAAQLYGKPIKIK